MAKERGTDGSNLIRLRFERVPFYNDVSLATLGPFDARTLQPKDERLVSRPASRSREGPSSVPTKGWPYVIGAPMIDAVMGRAVCRYSTWDASADGSI